MEITINGEKRNFDSPKTLAELLQLLEFGSQPVVVERNLKIVSPQNMEKVYVSDGDTLEIIRFVSGG